jgi:hypothetical protein
MKQPDVKVGPAGSGGRKLRPGTLLELGALVTGCAVLGYFTCREPAESENTPERAARVFAAPRASEGSGSADLQQNRSEIERILGAVLMGIARGDVSDEQRGQLQADLLQLLERRGSGRPETRANAAGMIVQQLFDRAKVANVTSDLSVRQREAIPAMASELTRQLLLLAVGASPGADALPVTLPQGHVKLDWKQMGGFQYQEGAQLPPAIQGLHGQKAGIAGFILTVGESEGMREFILLESLWGCCFGGVPDVNQTIVVKLPAERSFDYTAAPVLVTGTLEVGEEREGQFVASLYRLVDAEARPLVAATGN